MDNNKGIKIYAYVLAFLSILFSILFGGFNFLFGKPVEPLISCGRPESKFAEIGEEEVSHINELILSGEIEEGKQYIDDLFPEPKYDREELNNSFLWEYAQICKVLLADYDYAQMQTLTKGYLEIFGDTFANDVEKIDEILSEVKAEFSEGEINYSESIDSDVINYKGVNQISTDYSFVPSFNQALGDSGDIICYIGFESESKSPFRAVRIKVDGEKIVDQNYFAEQLNIEPTEKGTYRLFVIEDLPESQLKQMINAEIVELVFLNYAMKPIPYMLGNDEIKALEKVLRIGELHFRLTSILYG